MPSYVYFNAYNTNDNANYQRTGSTCTWIDNSDTEQFSGFTGDNQFWPSPDVRQEELAAQDFLICWGDDSIANSTSKGGTAKITYWAVANSDSDAIKLRWLNLAIREAGGTPQGTLALGLNEAQSQGIWTNYNTDIVVGIIN